VKRRSRTKGRTHQLTPGLVLGSPWESPIGGSSFGGRKSRRKSGGSRQPVSYQAPTRNGSKRKITGMM